MRNGSKLRARLLALRLPAPARRSAPGRAFARRPRARHARAADRRGAEQQAAVTRGADRLERGRARRGPGARRRRGRARGAARRGPRRGPRAARPCSASRSRRRPTSWPRSATSSRARLDALGDRLVAIYKGDDPDAATLLLQSDGFEDLATRIEYLERIEDADADLAARVRGLRDAGRGPARTSSRRRRPRSARSTTSSRPRGPRSPPRGGGRGSRRPRSPQRARDQADALAGAALPGRPAGPSRCSRPQQVSAAEAQQTRRRLVRATGRSPTYIVMCESGGNFGAVNPSSGAGGAYQILPSTWDAYGGEGKPQRRIHGGAGRDRRADLGRFGVERLGLRRLAPRGRLTATRAGPGPVDPGQALCYLCRSV